MALFSLFLLAFAILLGFFRKMNPGLICIGFSLILGRVADIPDKQIIAGFNYSLFLTLLGVTYLFSLAQNNGTLKLLAVKVVSLAGSRTYLIPVFIFVFATVLSGIGPGTIPTIAIMTVFSMSLAAELGIHPAMLAALVVLSASGGGISPIAPTGIIAQNLCSAAGITQDVGLPFLVNGVVSTSLYGAVVYFLFGGHKLASVDSVLFKQVEPFNRQQVITLIGIAVMVFMVMFLHVNVGLASFLIAAVLSALGVADEVDALKKVPWGTLVLVGGVSVLINLIVYLGGIKMLSAAMASVMTPSTAPSLLSLSAGVLSWVSSSSGVVMPTFIPTVPGVVAEMQGLADPVELATALSMVAHTAGISPLSGFISYSVASISEVF
ncbi:MAG: hypothetical protein HUK26_06470 [Duodenibacillus sp.]|nr:hypothetical protein [Duodenibacillus sp.]